MEALFLVIVIVLSVIVHEVAHGYAADWLGDPTARLAGRLTLNPVPHIDPFGSVIIPALMVFLNSGILFGWAKPVPYNPYNLRNQRWGEAIVAVAGSATNLLLAVIFALIARFAGDALPAGAAFAQLVAYVNLFLGLLNLIPIPPLDGFTVLRGILPFSLSYQLRSLEAQMQGLGVGGLILVLVLFSFFLKPFSLLVSIIFNFLVGG